MITNLFEILHCMKLISTRRHTHFFSFKYKYKFFHRIIRINFNSCIRYNCFMYALYLVDELSSETNEVK